MNLDPTTPQLALPLRSTLLVLFVAMALAGGIAKAQDSATLHLTTEDGHCYVFHSPSNIEFENAYNGKVVVNGHFDENQCDGSTTWPGPAALTMSAADTSVARGQPVAITWHATAFICSTGVSDLIGAVDGWYDADTTPGWACVGYGVCGAQHTKHVTFHASGTQYLRMECGSNAHGTTPTTFDTETIVINVY